jgi:hypothetical protein
MHDRSDEVGQGQERADADHHEDGQPAELGAAAAEADEVCGAHEGNPGSKVCPIFNLDLKTQASQLYI